MEVDDIDKSLYSRQLYTIGKEAMDALKSTSVMISGMTGLGVEVAKCVILSGVKSVCLHDTGILKSKELSSNYYASMDDVGKYRVDVVKLMLSKLNPYVDVSTDNSILNEEHFKKHQIVVMCDQLMLNEVNNNRVARKYGTKFIMANTMGLMGSIFCDFGKKFCVNDTNGETPRSGVLTEIKDFYFHTNEHHQLYVGDIVKINYDGKEVVDEVDKVFDAKTFRTKKTNKKYEMLTNTTFLQVKNTVLIDFLSLEESLKTPEFVTIIDSDFDRPQLLHDFHNAVCVFAATHGRLPKSYDKDDAYTISSMVLPRSDLHKNVVNKFAYTCSGKLCPIDSIFGSIVAQEVLKASSMKYTPIKQWLYMDFTSVLHDDIIDAEIKKYECDEKDDTLNVYSRYESQISIFGKDFQEKLTKSNIFIVGAGAIGCELLKNLAMMGIGNITITDMDTIEKSNLNRQFLFGYDDIGKSKSECAKAAVQKMNSSINIVAHKNKIAFDTINIYNKKFFSELTCTLTALDNIQARIFVDSLCVDNKCPLVDSGTLGTKGNIQTIVPYLTESYGSASDPVEQDIPMCTIKYFPYLIEHCIQWARNLFEGMFVNAPKNFMRYKKNPEKIKSMSSVEPELKEIINDVLFIHNNSAYHNKECIKFAYKLWFEHFGDNIHHLRVKFPQTSVTTEGAPYWSGTKKFPNLIKFDANVDINIEFIEATSNLWADIFGLQHVTKKQIHQFLKKNGLKEPKINDPVGEIIVKDEKDKSVEPEDSTISIDSLPSIDELDYNVNPIEFEKDNDANFHIDFITNTSILRALNYSIPEADKFKTLTKLKIILMHLLI